VRDFVNGLARMEFAISLYGPDDEVPFHVRWLYSQALVGAGEGYRALRMLTTIIEEERAAGESAGMRAPTHLELAKAYVQADDPRAHDEFALATDLFIEAQMWAEAAEATLLQPGD